MKHHFTCLLAIGVLVSCSRKNETKPPETADTPTVRTIAQPPVTPVSFSGSYEYSEPGTNGYLYYKMELFQYRDSITGSLLAGNYLAASEGGGFTNPNTLLECSLIGSIIKNNEAEIIITVTKSEIIEEGAPDLYGIMNFPDLDTDKTTTVWIFKKEEGMLTCTNGTLMPDGETEAVLSWQKIQ